MYSLGGRKIPPSVGQLVPVGSALARTSATPNFGAGKSGCRPFVALAAHSPCVPSLLATPWTSGLILERHVLSVFCGDTAGLPMPPWRGPGSLCTASHITDRMERSPLTTGVPS